MLVEPVQHKFSKLFWHSLTVDATCCGIAVYKKMLDRVIDIEDDYTEIMAKTVVLYFSSSLLINIPFKIDFFVFFFVLFVFRNPYIKPSYNKCYRPKSH